MSIHEEAPRTSSVSCSTESHKSNRPERHNPRIVAIQMLILSRVRFVTVISTFYCSLLSTFTHERTGWNYRWERRFRTKPVRPWTETRQATISHTVPAPVMPGQSFCVERAAIAATPLRRETRYLAVCAVHILVVRGNVEADYVCASPVAP